MDRDKLGCVNQDGLSISHNIDPRGGMSLLQKSESISISQHSILFVRSLEQELYPFPGFGFFEIETFYKVYLFMVNDEPAAKAWVKVLVELYGRKIIDPSQSWMEKAFAIPDFDADAFLVRPACLKLGKKRVFNFRRVVFSTHSSLPRALLALTPNEVIEKALHEAFLLLDDTTNAPLWVTFMDTVSALQVVDLSPLSGTEQTAFLLNLYHTMVIHGMLILGPPVPSSWSSFFNTVSYLVGFDVVSLNELECNGIRYYPCCLRECVSVCERE